MNAGRDLVHTLIPEVFQAERSGSRHTRIEADRIGVAPPAEALRAVAAHAADALSELTPLTDRLGLRTRAAGQALGIGFSILRNRLGDPLLDEERSYRATLLGIRHGMDAVRLLRAAAAREPGYEPLVAFCDTWLPTRCALARSCVDALDWFAEHPDVARQPVWAAQVRQVGRALDGRVVAGVWRGWVGAQ